ncbi:MAG TPA: T9SS type A sorting domain-containing protein [bacterium (Candidatus Stahlbacteria)]|nr:T9SS type A sorting domain-containing protein [Candidatus Stahlbacteria bacterium]
MALLFLIPALIFGVWDYRPHDVNNVECWVSDFAVICQQQGGSIAGLKWEKWTNHYYVFGAGIWFGTILAGGDTCVSVGYNPNSGYSEFVPGLVRQGTTAVNNPYVRVYIYPEDWPPDPDTFPMAPQGVRTDEDSWTCFNENDSTYHVPGDKHPIGLEVYQTGYADLDCMDAVFFKYEMKNCTTYTILNSYIGICMDHDIGEAGDDMYGLILRQWFPQGSDSFYIDALPYGYDYDWQEVGWDSVGVVGVYMLETPDSVGPTTSMRFSLDIDPSFDYQRYQVLKGINYQTGESLGFMVGDTAPNDKRFLFATGPFDLAPGEVKEFAFVIVLAYDTITIAYKANEAKQLWEQQIGIAEGSSREVKDEKIATITNGRLVIGRVDEVEIFDAMGRAVMRIRSPRSVIDLNRLSQGIYFAILKKGSGSQKVKILIVR